MRTTAASLDIDLRVGDYAMDNTHEIRGGLPSNLLANVSTAAVPVDNDPDAIRAILWYQTDQRYKRALEQFTRVKTNAEVKVAQEDQSDDLATSSPSSTPSSWPTSTWTAASGKKRSASTQLPSRSTRTSMARRPR